MSITGPTTGTITGPRATFANRRAWRRRAAAVLAGVLLAVGCGGGGEDGGGAPSSTNPPGPTTTEAAGTSGDGAASTVPVMTAPTVPAGAAQDGCPEELPPEDASAADAVEQLVRRRLAAVDGTNAACLEGLFAPSFSAASIFTPTPVAVGTDPAAPTGQTAVRDEPGTRFVGPVSVDAALTERFCGNFRAPSMSDADLQRTCAVGSYPMASRDGRTFTEFAHVARGSVVFRDGRFTYDGQGTWSIAFYGFATPPA
jgi:hypothetical protein